MRETTIGVDLGTSALKVCLVDFDGHILSEAQRPYETSLPGSGWAEQIPEQWWLAVCEATREAVEAARKSQGALRVLAVGLTGQMHSFVLLDDTGSVIRPAVTWMDTRAGPLVPEIEARLSAAGLLSRVQNQVAAGLTLCPLVWLARNEPESLEKAAVLLHVKDYVRYRMTGNIATDPTDASATLMFDVGRRRWAPEVCRLFDLPEHILPPVKEPGEVGGKLTTEAAQILALEPGTVVATGAGDQQAACLANGVLAPGDVQVMLGTGGQVVSPTLGTIGVHHGLNVFSHLRGTALQGSVKNAGASLTWVCDILGIEWNQLLEAAECCETTSDPDGPFFLPYLTGERTPIMREDATGAWLRLRRAHSSRALRYASLEGVVFAISEALEAVLRSAGIAAAGGRNGATIKVGGGGARSPEYLQLLADTVGHPLRPMQQPNASAVGAAMLGAIAGGHYSDFEDAVARAAPPPSAPVEPRPDRHEWLRRRHAVFKQLRSSYLPR